jgi:hypothetical protein
MPDPLQIAIAILLDAGDWMHILHLRTQSYTTHLALNSYYSFLTEAGDRLAEQATGDPLSEVAVLSETPELVHSLHSENPVEYSATIIDALRNIADNHCPNKILQSTLYDIIGQMYQQHYLLKRAAA